MVYISFPSVLQLDTGNHYPVDNDGVNTQTVAVVVMAHPTEAAVNYKRFLSLLNAAQIHTDSWGSIKTLFHL